MNPRKERLRTTDESTFQARLEWWLLAHPNVPPGDCKIIVDQWKTRVAALEAEKAEQCTCGRCTAHRATMLDSRKED